MAQVASVNVGRPRTVAWRGREVTTAIWKAPVAGRVPVRGVNVAGDDQADRRVHGGRDKSLYAYGLDDYRWAVGGAVLEVTAPRIPCFKLGIRMGDDSFPRRFAAALRPGAYLAIVQEGEVGAGDPVEVVHRPGHQVSVRTVARAYHGERGLVADLLDAPELPEGWRLWAEQHQAARMP